MAKNKQFSLYINMQINPTNSTQNLQPIDSNNGEKVSVEQKSATAIAKQLVCDVKDLVTCIAAKPRNVEFIDKGVTALSQGIQKSKKELNELGGYLKSKFSDISKGISKGIDNASSAISSTADKVRHKLGEAKENLRTHFENAKISVNDRAEKIRSLFENTGKKLEELDGAQGNVDAPLSPKAKFPTTFNEIKNRIRENADNRRYLKYSERLKEILEKKHESVKSDSAKFLAE